MRIVRCVFAAWYLLASTNLPAFALDQLLPQTKTLVAADFPCAHHDCGCKTAEQCRLRCCCHPKPTVKSPSGQSCHLPHQAPRTVRVSYLSTRYCETDQTQPDALTLHKLEPHLPVRPYVALGQESLSQLRLTGPLVVASVFLDPPDKIPI